MYGEHIERLEEAAAKGKDVPALRSRPEIPGWLLPALDAWHDLQGEVTWAAVTTWADRYKQDDEWLLVVLRRALFVVSKHKEKSKKNGNRKQRNATADLQDEPVAVGAKRRDNVR